MSRILFVAPRTNILSELESRPSHKLRRDDGPFAAKRERNDARHEL